MELPDKKKLYEAYICYGGTRLATAKEIESRLESVLSSLSPRPTVKGRIKDFDSYYKKYINLLKQSPGCAVKPRITDIIGIRVVCPFIANLDEAQHLINTNFEVIDTEKKGSNYSYKEFGYESIHLLITIPKDIVQRCEHSGCEVAEIQIRTILQDAWAEVEHELVYKAEFTPYDEPMKRKLAAINASLSLSDIIFQEIRTYQQQLRVESLKRREDFFNKLDKNVDTFIDTAAEIVAESKTYALLEKHRHGSSMDELLLEALYAHNAKNFTEAIDLYTQILSMNPDNKIISIIYNHRGMAHFAQSLYTDAVADFDKALEYDAKAYKAAYYRGLVRLVRQEWDDAIADFSLSLAINPYQPFCLYRRAHAYHHLGDKIQALSDCEAALIIMPEYEDALKFKKFLLNKMPLD